MDNSKDISWASLPPILHIPTYQHTEDHLSNTLPLCHLPPHHFPLHFPLSSDHPDSTSLTTLRCLQAPSLSSQLTQNQKEEDEGIRTYFRNLTVILVHLHLKSWVNAKLAIHFSKKAFPLLSLIIQEEAGPPAQHPRQRIRLVQLSETPRLENIARRQRVIV